MHLQMDRSMEGWKNEKSEEWKDGSSREVEVWDGPSRLPYNETPFPSALYTTLACSETRIPLTSGNAFLWPNCVCQD